MSLFLVLAVLAGGDGWSRLDVGGEKVEVYRDAWGIPHLFAPSVAEVFRAQGYIEAEDRLWQMDIFRRASKGESAELLGADSLPSDRDRRRRGYTEEEYQALFDAGRIAR